MRYLLVVFIITLFTFSPSNALSQEISIAPYSFPIHEGLSGVGQASLTYKGFGGMILWPNRQYSKEYWHRSWYGDLKPSVGIMFLPKITKYFNFGAVYFNNDFPFDHGTNLHFISEGGIDYKDFRFSFIHISSGGKGYNPGIGTIRIQYSFK